MGSACLAPDLLGAYRSDNTAPRTLPFTGKACPMRMETAPLGDKLLPSAGKLDTLASPSRQGHFHANPPRRPPPEPRKRNKQPQPPPETTSPRKPADNDHLTDPPMAQAGQQAASPHTTVLT